MSKGTLFILWRASLIAAVTIAFFFFGFSSFLLFSYGMTAGFSSYASMVLMAGLCCLLPFLLTVFLSFYFHIALKKSR